MSSIQRRSVLRDDEAPASRVSRHLAGRSPSATAPRAAAVRRAWSQAGGAGLCALALFAAPAHAALVVYSGSDIVATTTSPHPTSAAAAAAFDAAAALIGTSTTVTFEGATLGSFGSLVIAPGVTLTGTDYDGVNQTIRNTSASPSFPTLDGYNTTAGGSYFVEVQAGTLTFTFATPTQFFGAYFSGIQTNFYADSISFSDGTSQSLLVPGTGSTSSTGALAFLGFTDSGKFITSITLNAGSRATGADFIGVDDVRFQVSPRAVPEPGVGVLALAGVLALVGSRRRPRRVEAPRAALA